MDINLCIHHLGLSRNEYRLTQSVPPHSIAEWSGADPQPTQEQLETAWAEWQAEQDANAYKASRAAEYPAIGDQLDALFKHLNYRRTQGDELVQDLDDVIGSWLSVKAKYPKPE